MDTEVIELKMQNERPVVTELPPVLVTVKEAMRLTQLGESTLYQLIANGELPSKRIGRSVRIPYKALEKWANGNTKET